MAERLDRTERLLNLLFAFMSAAQPMSRSTVREVVAGYTESASDEAFERMFERDKDELRSLGIPVTTVTNASGEVEGYLIPRDSYALQEVHFSPEELGAISLAANAWDEAVFAPAASLAVRKLEASTQAGVGELDAAFQARIDASEAALAPVISLLNAGTAMSFRYRKSGALESETRTVTPITLSSKYGHWYLAGVDHDRDDVRIFRLSRIESVPKPAGERRGVPTEIDVNALIEVSEPGERSGVARIRVLPERAMSLRRQGSVEGDILSISYTDETRMVRDIVAAGSAAVVLGPEELVARVRAALGTILAEHEGVA